MKTPCQGSAADHIQYIPVAEEGVVCLVAVASCSVMIGVNCQDQGHSVPSVPAHTVAIM